VTTIRSARPKLRSLPRWKIWLIRGLLLAVVGGALYLWPEGLFAIVAGTAIVVIAVVWWLKRRLRAFVEPFKQLAEVDLFPSTIELTQTSNVRWKHAASIDELSRELAARGFEPVGDYAIGASPGVHLRAWMHVADAVYAVVYDREGIEPHVDFVTPFADGSYLTYTTIRAPSLLDRPPTMQIEGFPGARPGEVLEKFLHARPDKPCPSVSAGAFVPTLERYVAEESVWQQQQLDREEQLEQQLQEAFLQHSGWSAVRWDREQQRVVFGHDKLRSDDAVQVYLGCLGGLDEGAFAREEARAKKMAAGQSARTVLAELVRTAPPAWKFEKLAELTEPVPADVYLAPAWE
jgi:hypothetical protein